MATRPKTVAERLAHNKARLSYNRKQRAAKRAARGPLPPRRQPPKEVTCAGCHGTLSNDTIHAFCDDCRERALRWIWSDVDVIPIKPTPISAITFNGRFVGVMLLIPATGNAKRDDPSNVVLSISDRVVAGALHRQGRLLQRKAK